MFRVLCHLLRLYKKYRHCFYVSVSPLSPPPFFNFTNLCYHSSPNMHNFPFLRNNQSFFFTHRFIFEPLISSFTFTMTSYTHLVRSASFLLSREKATWNNRTRRLHSECCLDSTSCPLCYSWEVRVHKIPMEEDQKGHCRACEWHLKSDRKFSCTIVSPSYGLVSALSYCFNQFPPP